MKRTRPRKGSLLLKDGCAKKRIFKYEIMGSVNPKRFKIRLILLAKEVGYLISFQHFPKLPAALIQEPD